MYFILFLIFNFFSKLPIFVFLSLLLNFLQCFAYFFIFVCQFSFGKKKSLNIISRYKKFSGQPHVAFLSFHALLCLRKCMTRGIFVLDSQVNSFNSLCELIANTMASDGAACPNVTTTRRIMQILHLRHKWVIGKFCSKWPIKKSGMVKSRHSLICNRLFKKAILAANFLLVIYFKIFYATPNQVELNLA